MSEKKFLSLEGLQEYDARIKQKIANDVSASVEGLATEDYVNSAIAAIPTPDVSGQIDTHNTSTSAHSDIREAIAANTSAIELLTNGVSAEGVDGVKDLIQYVEDHGSEVTGMKADIKANADAIAAIPQADYAQNDPTAPDYVKNRLAWSDYSEAEILPETTITIVQSEYIQESVIGLQEGFSYIVNWNGISYKCVCSKVSDGESEAFVLGNLGILGAGGDTGEPFVMMDDPVNNIFGVVAAEDADYTVSITEFSETVHRIDPKYLPKGGFGYDEGTIIFDETITVSGGSYLYQTLGLVEGRTYVVNIDGVKYECVCKSIITGNGTFNYIGNDRIMGLENNTGESFCIVDSPEQEMSAISLMQEDLSEAVPDGDYHIIINDSQIHKIDSKFMPDEIAKVEDLVVNNIDGLQVELAKKLECITATRYKDILLPKSDNYDYMAPSWGSVTYGNGKFVATSDNRTVAYSEDGINWVHSAEFPLSVASHIVYGNGKFVIFDGARIYYSEDGINWNDMTMPTSSESWYDAAYGDGKFVVAANNSNTALYSEDGVNWTETTMPDIKSDNSCFITYGNGKFVAVGRTTSVGFYSEDGINWNEMTMPSDKYWCNAAYGDGKFVVAANNSNTALYSEDGVNWTETTMPDIKSYNSHFITYGDGKFVVVVSSSSVGFYSEDGINWNEMTMPSDKYWYNVTYGDGKFIATTHGSNVVAYSEDGIVWVDKIKIGEYNYISQNDVDITEDTALAVKDYLSITDIAKIETAEVGQTLVVKSVDENGRPTEWEAVSFGTVTTDEINALFQ